MPVTSVSWKASLPIAGRATWPVMATMGTESICAVAMPVTRLVAPGPEVAMHTPTLPVTLGVAVGGHGRALLVAREDMPDLWVLGEGLVEWQDGATRDAEHHVDPLHQQALANYLSARQLHAPYLRGPDFDQKYKFPPLRDGNISRGTTLFPRSEVGTLCVGVDLRPALYNGGPTRPVLVARTSGAFFRRLWSYVRRGLPRLLPPYQTRLMEAAPPTPLRHSLWLVSRLYLAVVV